MLIATPYRDIDVKDRSPPKVISEIRKTYLSSAVTNLRPKLSADLLVKYITDKSWYPRRVQIRGGQLLIFSSGEQMSLSFRIPLRHLSLQAGPLPHSLAICRGQNIVLTLQTPSEKSFNQWVKVIAIELIRQTPLDAIKYLDIFTLAECWKRRDENYARDWNFNNVISQTEPPCLSCEKSRTEETKEFSGASKWNPQINKRVAFLSEQNISKYYTKINIGPATDNSLIPQNSSSPEEVVQTLLKKCQNVETYVPVKEKLYLFESLCRMGRKVRSSEDVSLTPEKSTTKRAKSCHDLSDLNTHTAVREMCKYFENRESRYDNSNSPQTAFNHI